MVEVGGGDACSGDVDGTAGSAAKAGVLVMGSKYWLYVLSGGVSVAGREGSRPAQR